jgi:hypothetical protein
MARAAVAQPARKLFGVGMLSAFERKWAPRCPGVVRSLQEGGEELLTFFQFPKRQWKTLRTSNVIERLNEEIVVLDGARMREVAPASAPVPPGLRAMPGGAAICRELLSEYRNVGASKATHKPTGRRIPVSPGPLAPSCPLPLRAVLWMAGASGGPRRDGGPWRAILHVRLSGLQTPLCPGEFATEIRGVVESGEQPSQRTSRAPPAAWHLRVSIAPAFP